MGRSSKSSRVRFRGRGRAGEEENGSKAGRREDGCLLEVGVGDPASSRSGEGAVIVQ